MTNTRIIKRGLVWLLAVCMMILVFPVTALAATSTVTVEAQIGTIYAGTAGSATCALTTDDTPDVSSVAIAWYEIDGSTPATPTGLSAAAPDVSANASVVTVTATSAAVAGTYYFKATVDSVVSSLITVTVSPDVTAPILSVTSASDVTDTTATLNFTADEAGTYYYLIYAAIDAAPNAATVKAQGTAIAKGTAAASAAANTAGVIGLTAETAYKAYVIVEDAALNASAVAEIILTTTAAPSSSSSSTTTIATSTSDGVTTSTITVNGTTSSGTTTASVTNSAMEDLVSAAKKAELDGEKAIITIKVITASTTEKVEMTISGDEFSEMADRTNAELKVDASIGSIIFNAEAVESIRRSAGSADICITITSVNAATLFSDAQELIGDRPVYDFSVTAGSKQISIFGDGSVQINMPYVLANDEDANSIVIYYISDNGELVLISNCVYNASTNMVTFITTHFSTYAVGYKNVSFSDVSGWYANHVSYLAARGIINGLGDGTFGSDSNITRAQFIMILSNLAGVDLSSYTTSSFDDLAITDWYFAPVQWAYENGVALGSAGKFNPNANITRQDIAVLIARYAEKIVNYTLPEISSATGFTDSASISGYAVDAVTAMQQAGIINGKDDGSFAPTSNTTRAEAAKMIALFLQGMIG